MSYTCSLCKCSKTYAEMTTRKGAVGHWCKSCHAAKQRAYTARKPKRPAPERFPYVSPETLCRLLTGWPGINGGPLRWTA